MSLAALKDSAVDVAPPRESTGSIVRAGLRSLIALVPALLGSGVKGALKGFFLFGCFGLALAGVFVLAPRWTGAAPTPAWLDVLGFVLTPLALAVAGGYVWMLHGVSSRLASEVRARGLMGYAYAILKPATLQVARRLRGAGTPGRAELTRAIEQSVAERMREPEEARESASSRATWLEGFLMDQSRRVLGLIALRAVLTSPDMPSAVRELETLAIDRLEGVLEETLEDLFFLQMVLTLAAGILVAALPTLLLLFLPH
ncbi:hypothetical protein [Corallococcus aberystwythensis]|uniref:Uncharacterized protein n=1 Tax=Corallococcus aberystwythensis TaxID=2316722 RepID=A0A3A8PJD7_9BACT|nr:hypothetical protein [Corallococcus aberystwythensis]RKH56486.1 hypothetical protein D7W81_33670 [Corallococcus aberystwythensis]